MLGSLSPRGRRARRRGIAATELAIVAPLLVFLFVVVVDFSRIFYHYLTITNAARNGAMYGSDPIGQVRSPFTSIEQAALADATNLTPTPTVTSTTGTDADGNPYVEVTVAHQFQTVTSYPGIPSTYDISRTVRMRIAPAEPSEPNYSGDGDTGDGDGGGDG